jgi:hypothetical protein
VEQQIEDQRFERDRFAAPPEFAPGNVEAVIAKDVFRVGPLPRGRSDGTFPNVKTRAS